MAGRVAGPTLSRCYCCCRLAASTATRGCSAVGSALRSHRRGPGFDSPQLHHVVRRQPRCDFPRAWLFLVMEAHPPASLPVRGSGYAMRIRKGNSVKGLLGDNSDTRSGCTGPTTAATYSGSIRAHPAATRPALAAQSVRPSVLDHLVMIDRTVPGAGRKVMA